MTTATLPSLLLLGSYHMGNFNRDLFNLRTADSRLLQHQKEIEECANLLQAFQPTKVAIEVQTERDKEINEMYQQYRNGSHALTDDERQQLGFRVAAALGHECIYPIDWNEPKGTFPFFASLSCFPCAYRPLSIYSRAGEECRLHRFPALDASEFCGKERPKAEIRAK